MRQEAASAAEEMIAQADTTQRMVNKLVHLAGEASQGDTKETTTKNTRRAKW